MQFVLSNPQHLKELEPLFFGNKKTTVKRNIVLSFYETSYEVYLKILNQWAVKYDTKQKYDEIFEWLEWIRIVSWSERGSKAVKHFYSPNVVETVYLNVVPSILRRQTKHIPESVELDNPWE